MALFSTIFQALLRKGTLLGVLLLVVFGIVELALWVFAPVSPYANYEFEFTNAMEKYGLGKSSSFAVDAREVRKRPAAEGRSKALKVLVLGGEGNYQPLQNVGETWWGRLAEEMERQNPEVGLDMYLKASPAGSRPGQGTSMRQAVSWAKTYAEEIAPAVMVVAFGISEVLDAPADFRYNPTTMQMLPGAARPSSMKDTVAGISQIARRVRLWRKTSSQSLLERKALLEEPNHFLKILSQKQAIYESMRFDVQPPRWTADHDPKLEYLDGIRTLHGLAKRLGAELVVVAEPTLHDDMLGMDEIARLNRPRWIKHPTVEDPNGVGLRPDPAWVERELSRFYEAAEGWTAKERIAFVNLNRESALAKSVTNFVDDTTLTHAGSQRVADEVAPALSSAIKKVLAE